MSNSKLATARYPAHPNNYWGTRSEGKIDKIIIHYMYARWTAKRCCESFQDPNRKASCNYCIGYAGEIAVSVDENLASGCSSNREADMRGVTIEVANDNMQTLTHSEATMKSLIALCADIAKRNDLGNLVPGKNLTWHSMYAATSCPGKFLLDRMDYIADEANKINNPADGSKGQLAGINIPRAANTLVMYSGKKTTGTNQYGYEVAVDKNAVALSAPQYKGNTTIPTGGRVYSGHGKAGSWLHSKIKEGSLVWTEGSQVQVAYGKIYRSVDGVNAQRATDYLCVYNKGSKATTNKWGYEVTIVNGKAQSKPVYGVGSMAIPKGGFVISGHGKAGKWIAENIKEGSEVTFDGKKICVKQN